MRMYVYMHIKIHVYIYLRTNENTRKHRTQRLKKAFCLIGFDSIMWNLHSPFSMFTASGAKNMCSSFSRARKQRKVVSLVSLAWKWKKPPFAFLSSTSPSQKARITENCALKHSPPTSGVGRDRLCLTSDNTKPQIPNCRPRTSTLSTLILPHVQFFWVSRTLRMAASTKLIAACWSWAASTCTIQVPKGQKGLEKDKLGICRAFWGSHEFEPHSHRCTPDISEWFKFMKILSITKSMSQPLNPWGTKRKVMVEFCTTQATAESVDWPRTKHIIQIKHGRIHPIMAIILV